MPLISRGMPLQHAGKKWFEAGPGRGNVARIVELRLDTSREIDKISVALSPAGQ